RQCAGDLGTAPSCSTSSPPLHDALPITYPTSCSSGASANYAFSYHDGSFKVGKATLDVTASSPADGVYGDLVPTITAIYGGVGLKGVVYSQGAGDLGTAAACSTTYTHTAASAPSTYPTSCSSGSPAHYTRTS